MTSPGTVAYAGPVSRAAAFVLDALLVFAVASVSMVGTGVVAAVLDADALSLARELLPAGILALPALLACYSAAFWVLAGRTPGMAVLGVRVVKADGRPVGWRAALVRALVLAYLPIGTVWMLVDRRHQALHDKLARTEVIFAADVTGDSYRRERP